MSLIRKGDRARDVLVLCYHAVSDRWPADLSVTHRQLEKQLRFRVAQGYRGATFYEAVNDPPAKKTVAVTFDDAYRSVLRLAYPVLSSLDLPGTVFVATDFADSESSMSWPGIKQWQGGPFEDELTCMSWQELGWLGDAGWEIGSHTRSHPRLTTVDDHMLAAELRESRELCEEKLRRPCHSLAYPYGDVDLRVIESAREAGYLAAADLPDKFDSAKPFKWPRVGIYRQDTDRRFRLKVSRTVRYLRSTHAWSAVNLVRNARD